MMKQCHVIRQHLLQVYLNLSAPMAIPWSFPEFSKLPVLRLPQMGTPGFAGAKLQKSLSKTHMSSHVLILFRFDTLKTLERRDVFPLKMFHDVSKIPNDKTLHRRSQFNSSRRQLERCKSVMQSIESEG